MKKLFFVDIVFLTFLVSCSSNYFMKTNECDISSESEPKNVLLKKYYSFNYATKKSMIPVISIKVNNAFLTFECDTGAATSFIHKSGMKKIVDDFQEWENDSIKIFLDELMMKNPNKDYTFSEAKKMYLDMARKGMSYTKYPVIFIQNDKSYRINLNYSNIKTKYDGVLGLDFFLQLNSIVFDYKEKEVYFNTDIISNEGSPIILIDEPIGKSLYIDCVINNEIERCLLDTGLNCCIIRQDFQKNKNESYESMASGNNKDIYMNIIESLKIASLEYNNIIFYYAVSRNFLCSDKVRNYYKEHSGLGFPVFENHIVQFDFENMRFYIL